jgi:hypothetical protein
MIEVKRLSGFLNTDDKVQDVTQAQHIDANNIRFTGGPNGLTAENIVGNYLITNNDLPAGDNYCIGAFFDQLNNRIIWFNYNSNGDNGIYELDIATEAVTPIFICGTQSTTDIFNFNLDYPVHSVSIVYRDGGDLLYWTDGYNSPKYLNIDSASIAALSPFQEEMITVIKVPPLTPIVATFGNDATAITNNVYNKYFRFSYRFVYVNDEKSTFSPPSPVPLPSGVPGDPILPGINNVINLQYVSSASGQNDFTSVEIYGQEYGAGIWSDYFLIATIDKSGALPYTDTFAFYNDSTYTPILPEESDLRYDRVPDKANTLELLNGNVIIYGGITEGYNAIKRSDISVQITCVSLNASTRDTIWKWSEKERFGLLYFDEYGKTNGVVSFLADASVDSTNFDVTTTAFQSISPGTFQTPRIRATINHLPPSWATAYRWVRIDAYPQFFLQWISNDYIDSSPAIPTGYAFIGVQTLLDANSNGFVPTYEWKPGDRVKIISQWITSGVETAYPTVYDFEILEVVARPMTPPNPATNGSYLKIQKVPGMPAYPQTPSGFLRIEIYTPTPINKTDVVFYDGWARTGTIYEIAGVKYHATATSGGSSQNQTAIQPCVNEFSTLTNGSWQSYVFYQQVNTVTDSALTTFPRAAVLLSRYVNQFQDSRMNSNARGWIIEPESKQEYLSASVRWGGAYSQDGTLNELNRFYPTSIDTIDRSRGDIRRLKSRERILRVFQDRGVGQYGVYTRYIQNNSGSNELVTTSDIITANNIQYYVGNYGLSGYPTNLVSSQNADYFTDVITGRSIRLASDGITDLGLTYKGQFYLSSLVTPYNKTITKANNGSKSKVMGFYDFNDDQYHIVLEGAGAVCESYTVTKTASTILPTTVYYTDCNFAPQSQVIALEGDVFNFCAIQGSVDVTTDGGGVLELVDNGVGACASLGPLPYNWSFNERRNAFCSFYDYHPEWAIGANEMIYTWLNGGLWKHNNQNEYCSFYTNPNNASLTIVFNNNLITKKSWNSVNEIATDIWEVPEMYTNSYSYGTPGFGPPAPQVQQSNLVAAEFTFLEGNPSTAIKRDSNSPGGKINGNFMKGNYLVMKLQKSSAQSLVTLSEISVRFTESPLTAK